MLSHIADLVSSLGVFNFVIYFVTCLERMSTAVSFSKTLGIGAPTPLLLAFSSRFIDTPGHFAHNLTLVLLNLFTVNDGVELHSSKVSKQLMSNCSLLKRPPESLDIKPSAFGVSM